MEKKLQITKNVNKDVKNCFIRPRKPELASERSLSNRQNVRIQNNSVCGNYHRNESRKNAKYELSLPLSLSNEDFILANAQILIKQSSTAFDRWEDVVQVNFYTEEELNCPICLSPPAIPRTDKCGHVYCLPCLLKYLSLKADFHNKCALCAQNIDIQRVKRAGIIPVFPVRSADMLTMLLMKRDKLGNSPLPIDSFSSNLLQSNSPESRFSNVAVCPNEDLLSLIQIEMITLKEHLDEAASEEGNDRLLSITQAIASVQYEFDEISSIKSIATTFPFKRDIETFCDFKEITSCNSVFYQALDGSNVFMCPINWKCMQHDFVNQGQCLPTRITAPVIEIEKYIVTQEFQNRYRYLQYLPLGSSVSFVEMDLKAIISLDALERFSLQLKEKSDSRVNKQRMDDILTSQKIKHEDSFNTSSRFIRLDSLMKPRGPETFTDDDFLPLTSSPTTEPSPKYNQGSSFAEILHRPMTNLSIRQDDEEDSQPRRFNLNDCLVVKKTKRKLR